jgi:uncharacterized membrane-anchored protein YitT (DUF2179 family)
MNRYFQSDQFKNKALPEIQRILAVVISTLIYGVGIAWFLEASVIPMYSGGIPGIGQLIRDILWFLFGIDLGSSFLGIFIFIINIPLLILGWFGISKRFAIHSLISVALQSIVLSWFPFVNMGLSNRSDALAAALIGGLLIGFGGGLALKYGTSTGGLDIIAQYVSLKKGKSVGFLTMIMNISVAVLGGIIVGGSEGADGLIISGGLIVTYTIIRIIISTVMVDRVHTSYHFLSVDIITQDPEPIVNDVLIKVYRGVTLIKVEGAYSHREKTLIYVVIAAYELHTLISLVKRIDPNAFIVTRPVKNVFGNFKKKTIA